MNPAGRSSFRASNAPTSIAPTVEFKRHTEELLEIARDLDLAILGLGMQPASRLNEIELLPKARYHIMFPYMARKGRLGQRMMKQTAGVQANLDYSDEADAMRKLRLSFALTPLMYAIFAQLAAMRRRP